MLSSFQLILRFMALYLMVLQHLHMEAIFYFFRTSNTRFQMSMQGEFLGRFRFTIFRIYQNWGMSWFLNASANPKRAWMSAQILYTAVLSCNIGLKSLSSKYFKSPHKSTINELIFNNSLFFSLFDPYLAFSIKDPQRKLAHSI